jgi:hypothetical protein
MAHGIADRLFVLLPVAGEAPARVGDGDALARRGAALPRLERRGRGGLRLHDQSFAFPPAAAALDELDGTRDGAVDDRIEGKVRVAELRGGDRGDVALPGIGDAIVAEHHAEDARGAGRVAVGVLSGARGYLDGFAHLAVAVEQSEGDIGAVQGRVDIERPQGPFGAELGGIPLLFDPMPHGLPIRRLGLGPGEDVGDQLVITAASGQASQSGFDDRARILLEECRRVHAGDEDSAVDALAVVHDAPGAHSDVNGGAGQSGGHQPDEIGFNLEVDVVGVDVVVRMARQFGRHSALEIAARGEIGVPERVARFAEHGRVIFGGRVEALVVEDLGEGHVDVEVVLVERVGDPGGRPLGKLVCGDDPFVETELSGSSVADADHLAGPAAPDAVAQLRHRNPPGGLRGCAPRHQCEYQEFYGTSSIRNGQAASGSRISEADSGAASRGGRG